MKTEISSLELLYVVKELQDLVNGRIDKVYQKDREFVLTMHVRAKGKKMLRIMPNAIYTTEYKEDFGRELMGFCKFLRKRLSGAMIKSIVQKGFERIVEIHFETKGEYYLMIIELFANGNVVICDDEYKVISALESHRWKDRTVRGGIKYEYPPTLVNTLELKEDEFKEIIVKSELDSIVKTLAINLGLGGLYAEELCVLAGVDKTKKKLSSIEITNLYQEWTKLLSKKISARIVGTEIMPFKLKLLSKEKDKSFATFNEAIDSKFSEGLIVAHEKEGDNQKNKKLNTIQVIINQQEQTIEGMGISYEENQAKGEFIYEHYNEIKMILAELDVARKKFSWEEIKERLQNHKVIKKIDEKNGKITIEL
ncbi:NFACT family protein [archaeon]|nr:NFACT family protein [archaeon]MBL7056775.1 NFACT family protein [Candidatus Woesearchaeota archaeon]